MCGNFNTSGGDPTSKQMESMCKQFPLIASWDKCYWMALWLVAN